MSTLLKIARAVDGDDLFAMRVRIACELANVEYTRPVLLHVARQVADTITCTPEGTVDTAGVDDEAIMTAIADLEGDAS